VTEPETDSSRPPHAAPLPEGMQRKRRRRSAGTGRVRRPGSNVRRARRHSRLVGILKVMLPVTALALAGIIFIYTQVYDADNQLTLTFTMIEEIDDDLLMTNPRFSGIDHLNRPFRVTADRAVQAMANPDTVSLIDVAAEMTLPAQGLIRAIAPSGVFDTKSQVLTLDGPVEFASDMGYTLHTDGARINLRSGVADSLGEVAGSGPIGEMRADRMTISESGRIIRLEGNAMLRLRPERARAALEPPAQDEQEGRAE
jgi:lipopolysaccharide export system protein LptC